MERTFIKVRDQIVNLNAICFIESAEDGSLAVTVQNRDKPFRLHGADSAAFMEVMKRFSVEVRADADE